MSQPIIRVSTVNIGSTVDGTAVWVKARITETIVLETGDSTTLVNIEQLATMKDGQLIHPKTLTVEEFRNLVAKIRRHEAYA